jgi:hypothetical protein
MMEFLHARVRCFCDQTTSMYAAVDADFDTHLFDNEILNIIDTSAANFALALILNFFSLFFYFGEVVIQSVSQSLVYSL